MTGPGLNATPAELLPSAVYLISYLNEARRRPRIAHLRRSPISTFTILYNGFTKSSYPASKPAGWPAEPAGYEPCSSLIHLPPLTRQSQLTPQAGVRFINSPLQASSTRSGELLHAGTVGRTGIVAAVHATASYRVSCFYGRDSHACGRAMQAETEAGCVESDESGPAPLCPPPSSRRSRTREAAAAWVP